MGVHRGKGVGNRREGLDRKYYLKLDNTVFILGGVGGWWDAEYEVQFLQFFQFAC